jgi:hypothetical protein
VKTAAAETATGANEKVTAWLLAAASINLSFFFLFLLFGFVSFFHGRSLFFFLDAGPHFATTSQTR